MKSKPKKRNKKAKMKTYIVSFSGAIDIKAKNEKEAEEKWMELTDAEIGRCIEEYEEINEAEDLYA